MTRMLNRPFPKPVFKLGFVLSYFLLQGVGLGLIIWDTLYNISSSGMDGYPRLLSGSQPEYCLLWVPISFVLALILIRLLWSAWPLCKIERPPTIGLLLLMVPVVKLIAIYPLVGGFTWIINRSQPKSSFRVKQPIFFAFCLVSDAFFAVAYNIFSSGGETNTIDPHCIYPVLVFGSILWGLGVLVISELCDAINNRSQEVPEFNTLRHLEVGLLSAILVVSLGSYLAVLKPLVNHYDRCLTLIDFYGKPIDIDVHRYEAQCRSAIRIDPDEPRFYTQLGNALFEQKRYSESAKAFEQAVQLGTIESLNDSEQGRYYYGSGQYDRAEKIQRKVIDSDDAWSSSYYELGLTLIKEHKLSEAKRMFLKVKEDPEYSGKIPVIK